MMRWLWSLILFALCGCAAVQSVPKIEAPVKVAASQPAGDVKIETAAQQAAVAVAGGIKTTMAGVVSDSVDRSTNNIWNDVRPWLLFMVAIAVVAAAAAVVVLLYWIKTHSYAEQKPVYEAAKLAERTATPIDLEYTA